MAQNGDHANQGATASNLDATTPLVTVIKSEPLSPCEIGNEGTMTPISPDVAPAVGANIVGDIKDVALAVGADVVGDVQDIVPAVGSDVIGDVKDVVLTLGADVVGDVQDVAPAVSSNVDGDVKDVVLTLGAPDAIGDVQDIVLTLGVSDVQDVVAAVGTDVVDEVHDNIVDNVEKEVVPTVVLGKHGDGAARASKGKGKRKQKAVAADEGAANSGSSTPLHHIVERERRKRMTDCYSLLKYMLPNVGPKADKAAVVGGTINYIKQLEGIVQNLEKQKKERIALARQEEAAAYLRAAAASYYRAPASAGGVEWRDASYAAADFGAGSSSQAPPATGILARQGAAADFVPGSSTQEPPAAGQLPKLALPPGWCWLPKRKPQQPGESAVEPPLTRFQTWSEPNVVLNVSGDDAYITLCTPRRPGLLTLVLCVMERHYIKVITMQIGSDSARTMFSLHTQLKMEEIKQLDPEPPESKHIFQLAVSEILIWLSG